ncbi:hypothetical protein BZG21_29505, partial [Escherichia coli]|nr:hypothetical protein [Escherichia coli]
MPQCKYGAATNSTNPTSNPAEQAVQLGIGERTIRRHNAKQCICYGQHPPSSSKTKKTEAKPAGDAKLSIPVGESETHNPDGSSNYTRFS